MNLPRLGLALVGIGCLQGCATNALIGNISEGHGMSCSTAKDYRTFAWLSDNRIFDVEEVGVKVDTSQPVHSACQQGNVESKVIYTPGCNEVENEADSLVLWKVVGASIWIRQGTSFSELMSSQPDGFRTMPHRRRGTAVLLVNDSVPVGAWNRVGSVPLLWVEGYSDSTGVWWARRLYWREDGNLSSSVLVNEMTDGKDCDGLPLAVQALGLPLTVALDIVTLPLQLLGVMIYSSLGGSDMFHGYH